MGLAEHFFPISLEDPIFREFFSQKLFAGTSSPENIYQKK